MTAPPSPPIDQRAVVLPLWRSTPHRVARLVIGLSLFGVGMALIVRSTLGNAPWTVFAEGLSVQTPLSIGQATIVIGLGVLSLWMPLRVRPGLGTLLNVVLIGLAIDATLAVIPPPADLVARVAMLLGGIATVGFGSGLYLGTQHGPGPRDGLMMGMHRATGLPIAPVRALIEVSALAVGWLLGGTVGVGTLAFALLIGPAVQAGLAIDRTLRYRREITGQARLTRNRA